MFRPEHIFESLDELQELSTFSGQSLEDTATFRPGRLMVHELLIRVTADYTVSDGNEYEALGNNFRAMASKIREHYLLPRQNEVEAFYEKTRREVSEIVSRELLALKPQEHVRSNGETSFWTKLLRKAPAPPAAPEPRQVIENWSTRSADETAAPIERAVCAALHQVLQKLLVRHGRVQGDFELITRLVTSRVMNLYGSETIGAEIEPWIAQGADKESFRRLPVQNAPVVMNVKGASAAGKSTLRPLQQSLVGRLGLRWQDFALISPDIFRKFLLDYESLGDAYKYAGTLSGQELQIVDQKLDRHVATRARNGVLTHLLIDRFRFDSFSPKSREQGSNLLTRFGARVYMYFVVTPPHATVERAWVRGLQVGRYKAVDDLLHHNIEAFNGMPELFFTWALDRDKEVSYEFLDNSVSIGETPRTIAFGLNGVLTILDVDRLMDINRFQKLNVDAGSADAVYYKQTSATVDTATTFLKACIDKLQRVDFASFDSGDVYASVVRGKRLSLNEEALNANNQDETVRSTLSKILHAIYASNEESALARSPLDEAAWETLGTHGMKVRGKAS